MRTSRLKSILPLVAFCAISSWPIAGCMQPVKPGVVDSSPKPRAEDPSNEGPLESNIVRVNKFFSSDPWLSFDSDGTSKVDGVRFTVYLEGPGTPHGVFGTGRIVVTMYGLDHDPTGSETAVQLYEWDMPSDKAYPWRAKQRTALGWGYGIRLQWDKKIDIVGRQVAFVVKYIREDGKVITSSRQVLKVRSATDGYMLTKAPAQKESPKIESHPRPHKAKKAQPVK